ncbi:MAG TPA: hypothetical protein VD913_01210 [bacterium]|nr:hypothetical protein [bacterium]
MNRILNRKTGGVLLATLIFLSAGCSRTYPADKLKESLIDICKTEYGIDNVEVKIVGKTIGVYLPLKKLFASDFKEALVSGKVRNIDTLFEPSPEALDKVEDVLFSISRVILSTDLPLEFYVLEATDVEKTGLQLVLTGYVDDIKRVRIWDISRDEYRKRVIHELRPNASVLWHSPVRQFFGDLETLPLGEIREKYFGDKFSENSLQRFFFNTLRTGKPDEPLTRWQVLDIRSTGLDRSGAVVYAKVKPRHDVPIQDIPEGIELEYLFLISIQDESARITRIIPFQYEDEYGKWNKVSFPKELQIEDNLADWKEEFTVEDIQLGDFLSEQLTRRVEGLITADERIRNTFQGVKLKFNYHEEGQTPYFSMDIEEALLRDFNNYRRDSVVLHEDMLYLLNLASREFVDVLRAYRFGNFDHLVLNIAQEPNSWNLGREQLELFRRRKIDFQGLLSFTNL